MEKLKELNEVKHSLIDAVKMEVAKGVQNIDAEELGEVIDMIKDLAEAEKACMEACYYENVTEAMSEDGEGRMGYDGWRYSSGRFAPKGRGHRVYGYLPGKVMMGDPWPMGYPDDPRPEGEREGYGYTRTGRSRSTSGRSTSSRMGYDGDFEGEPKTKLDKAMDVMGEVWADADADLRGKMKTTVRDLLYQMEQADR